MRICEAVFAQQFEGALFAVATSFETRYETCCFPKLVLMTLKIYYQESILDWGVAGNRYTGKLQYTLNRSSRYLINVEGETSSMPIHLPNNILVLGGCESGRVNSYNCMPN